MNTAKETAELLKRALHMKFGGKPEGRYFIDRDSLATVAGTIRLNESYLATLADAALNLGFVVIDIGSGFGILNMEIVSGYRRITQAAVQQVLGTESLAPDDE